MDVMAAAKGFWWMRWGLSTLRASFKLVEDALGLVRPAEGKTLVDNDQPKLVKRYENPGSDIKNGLFTDC